MNDISKDDNKHSVTWYDFKDPNLDRGTQFLMANVANALLSGLTFKQILEAQIVSKRTLDKYLNHPAFEQVIQQNAGLLKNRALSVMSQALDKAPWRERVWTAREILSADGGRSPWDPGIRKEQARVKGQAALETYKRTLTPEKIKEIRAKMPDKATYETIETTSNPNGLSQDKGGAGAPGKKKGA